MTTLPESEFIMKRLNSLLPELDTGFLETFVRVIHYEHAIPALFDQYFARMGLSKARFMVLIQIFVRGGEKGLGISELTRFYNVRSATLTGVIDTLEKEGLVERSHDRKDRRRINLRLTKEGKDFMLRFIPAHVENMKRMIRGFEEENLHQLLNLNARLVVAIESFLSSDQIQIPHGSVQNNK